MLRLGFEFSETMTGTFTHNARPGEQRGARFQLRAIADDAMQYLRDNKVRVEGTIELGGFADESSVAGHIEIGVPLRPFIRYELSFVANDGLPYRLVGQKDVRLTDLTATMSTLPAEVKDASGQTIARVQVAFDVKADLLKFLASWKPRFAQA
jgi:hypothetical protein